MGRPDQLANGNARIVTLCQCFVYIEPCIESSVHKRPSFNQRRLFTILASDWLISTTYASLLRGAITNKAISCEVLLQSTYIIAQADTKPTSPHFAFL